MANERTEYNHDIDNIVKCILQDYDKKRDIDKMDVKRQPDKNAVIDIVNKLLNIFFPGYYRDRVYKSFNDRSRLSVMIEDALYNLKKQIAIVLPYNPEYAGWSESELTDEAEKIAISFFGQVPKIRSYIDTDVSATYDGDPAAYDKGEIILSYPGLLATAINRVAHELFLLKVPLIPRIMTEYAHSITGIDIHPGATIGKYFMIDHGTGVVVGETSIIGEHVKVYQGVTIGALSTKGGQNLKGVKRHPTIEDNATIYAGASILGGNTVIGRNSVVGSNCFITNSVPEGTLVTLQNQELLYKNGDRTALNVDDLTRDETWNYVI